MSANEQQPGGGRFTEEQIFDWLRLIRCENVGPRTFRQLVNCFGGARAALEALPELAARSLQGRGIRIADIRTTCAAKWSGRRRSACGSWS